MEGVPRDEQRRLEVANNYPWWSGCQGAVDATLASLVGRNGTAILCTDGTDEVPRQRAQRCKERTYPEFGPGRRCRLVVLGVVVGGHWSNEAASFTSLLARVRPRAVARMPRRSTQLAFTSPWASIFAAAARKSFVASLLEGLACAAGEPSQPSDVLA